MYNIRVIRRKKNALVKIKGSLFKFMSKIISFYQKYNNLICNKTRITKTTMLTNGLNTFRHKSTRIGRIRSDGREHAWKIRIQWPHKEEIS